MWWAEAQSRVRCDDGGSAERPGLLSLGLRAPQERTHSQQTHTRTKTTTDPKAATPGCTKEACSFRDSYSRFTDAGAAVFGISSDSPEENKAWATANRLPFPLLTDPSSILRKTFGIKADLLGLLPGRQTYVFDKDAKCVLSFNSQFSPDEHVSEALRALGAKVGA